MYVAACRRRHTPSGGTPPGSVNTARPGSTATRPWSCSAGSRRPDVPRLPAPDRPALRCEPVGEFVLGERVTRHYDVLVVQGAFVRRDERPIVAEDAEQ